MAPREIVAKLGKKYLSPKRPAYSAVPPPQWRGMQLDWTTALSPDLLLPVMSNSAVEELPPLAISDVKPGSPAWDAGRGRECF